MAPSVPVFSNGLKNVLVYTYIAVSFEKSVQSFYLLVRNYYIQC